MQTKPMTDRRILRTRLAIRNALVSLIEEKNFNDLTIRDLAERAHINRGTFYLHYRDKQDLLDQTEQEIIEDFRAMASQINPEELLAHQQADQPLPAMVTFFTYFRENAAALRAILGVRGAIAFQMKIKQAIEENLYQTRFFARLQEQISQIPGRYLVSYTVSAHLGVAQTWLENGCQETPEEMALITTRLIFHIPLLSKAVEGNPEQD
ncbi:MAG: TetR/AcrR family transcriptional regulator [Anaerolineaceae bacterium]|nr:TetR/AcrR family transcriptional regulator [Anaerolineaceae bacterium]